LTQSLRLPAPTTAIEKIEKAKRKRAAVKIDPKHLKVARELRDRYLEQFNLGVVTPSAKYDVTRAIAEGSAVQAKLLPQAA